jgi:hypothetical protein
MEDATTMDRDRFDALVRLIAARRSRRGTLAALLGAALLGQAPDTEGNEGVGCGSTAQCCPGRICDDGECEEP